MEVSMNSPLKVDELLSSAFTNGKTSTRHSSSSESQVTSIVKNPFTAAVHV